MQSRAVSIQRTRPFRVAFPIVCTRLNGDALHRHRGIVTFLSRNIATVALGDNGAASIGVDEDLGRIEAHSAWRIESPLKSVAVDLPFFHARHKYVPVVVRAVG